MNLSFCRTPHWCWAIDGSQQHGELFSDMTNVNDPGKVRRNNNLLPFSPPILPYSEAARYSMHGPALPHSPAVGERNTLFLWTSRDDSCHMPPNCPFASNRMKVLSACPQKNILGNLLPIPLWYHFTVNSLMPFLSKMFPFLTPRSYDYITKPKLRTLRCISVLQYTG